MGHAYPKNLCRIFLEQLFIQKKISIKEIVDLCVERGEELSCSEGGYKEDFMIQMAIVQIVDYYLCNHEPKQGKATPVIRIVEPLTEEQTKIYNRFLANDTDDWGDDPYEGNLWHIFDALKWEFSKGWRKRYPNIPVLEYIES